MKFTRKRLLLKIHLSIFMLRMPKSLEAQQRYFSYRAILVAIVSRNSFVLVLMGYRAIIARYVAKRGIAQMCLCETKYQGGVSHHFGGVLTSLKEVSRDMGYRSDSIAVSRDMGPLSQSQVQGTIQTTEFIINTGVESAEISGFQCCTGSFQAPRTTTAKDQGRKNHDSHRSDRI